MGIFGLITTQCLEKLTSAGFGNGAYMFDDFLARHAYTVVGNRNSARGPVECNADFKIAIAFIKRII